MNFTHKPTGAPFFDLHLHGKPQPLMTAPSPDYPEVTFIG
jgi:hypothetical protein